MPKIKIYNTAAEAVGNVTLSDEIFATEYNEPLIHEVIVAQLANARQGTKSALTRSEVRGHAKKPWRQKGTGRARHGSTKAPQWTGGGVAFAPKPRDFSKKVNKKAKVVAFLSAMSEKIRNKEVIVLDEWTLAENKTKEMPKILNNFINSPIKHLIIPEGVAEILKSMFNNKQNIQEINLAKSIQSIEENIFREMNSLTKVHCNSDHIPYFNNENIISLEINKGCQEIKQEQISSFTNLTQIIIPSTVTSI